MATRSKQSVQHGKDDNYIKLVGAFPLRPIRSDSELDRAISVIDSLIMRDDLDAGEKDYLSVLSDLVHKYETEHDPIAPVPASEMVRFLLESNEMTQAELAQRSGIAESTVSEILAEKRKLSRRHIAALSRIFHVSPAVFFPETVAMTPEQIAETLSCRSGMEVSYDLLVSLASAFAMESECWRAFQELVAGEKPGTPPNVMAKRLNHWGEGGDCWHPAPFHLVAADLHALANAFSDEKACWEDFRGMVEDAIPRMRAIQRDAAEEN